MPVFLVVLLVASYFRIWRGQETSPQWVMQGQTMGTTYRVVVDGSGSSSQLEGLKDALREELDRINGLMSTYLPDSELSRFNRSRSRGPVPVSKDLAAVVAAARGISEQSDGAFDVTVKPLVSAWGFGADAKVDPPTQEELARLLASVGYAKLRADTDDGTLEKTAPTLSADLSAIAKGYAVDRLSQLLTQRGLGAHMVEIGGEVRVSGKKASGRGWRIGIERPDTETRGSTLVLELTDIGMATSGDYRNYYEREGKRISHTIDPRSGRPISHRLASVTVLHPQAMLADGYATALNVLGPDAGFELAERLELGVFFIVRNEMGAFSSRKTSRFEALVESMTGSLEAEPPDD